VRQPVIDGRGESGFRLTHDLVWQHTTHGFPENMFGHGTPFTFELQGRADIPSNKFGQPAIKKWNADFDGRGHAHFVVVSEIQRGHEDFGIEVEHLVQEIGVLHPMEGCAMLNAGIASKLAAGVFGVESVFLHSVEIGSVSDESILWTQSGAADHFFCEAY